MKILISGAAGFIASHIADAYIKQGHEVVIVDNLVTGNINNLNPAAKFYNLDICSPELEGIFFSEKPDIVNHHAAQVSVPLSVKDPLWDTQVNVKGFINILQNCVKYKTGQLIFASSGGAVYGEAPEYPSSESCPLNPLSPYAVSKAVSESFLYYYGKQFELNYTILRYANVYGPRQIQRGEAGVVSIFIENLLANRQSKIYAFVDKPEGMIRDYVYVKDVVKANVSALSTQYCDTFNIGTGIETSTSKLYEEISTQLGLNIKPVPGPARSGDLKQSLLDCKKAERLLSWKPQYSLQDGIAETIKYYKNKIQR